MKNGYFPPKGTIHQIMVDGIPLAAIVKRENYDYYKAHQYQNKKQMDTSFYLFQKAAQYAPKNEGPYREMGFIKMQQNDLAAAVPYFYKSVELCPENFYSYTFLGYVYQQRKMIDSAEFCFSKAVKYKANMSNAWEGLGSIALERNDPANAKGKFLRALDLGNQGVYLFYNLGRTYEMLSYPDSALLYYNYATQVEPNFPYPYKAMGDLLKRQGNPAAEQYLAKARSMGIP